MKYILRKVSKKELYLKVSRVACNYTLFSVCEINYLALSMNRYIVGEKTEKTTSNHA